MRLVNYITLALTAALLSSTYPIAYAQTESGIFELLSQDDIPQLQLNTDLSHLLEHKNADESYPAQLSWDSQTGRTENWAIKVSVRGKFRRMTCDFPPLRLKFNKDHLQARGFNKHNKLKLVTHCLDARGEGQQNLLKEYLAYQIYQELSPNSYRTQLVRIQYIDSSGKLGSFKRYAFLIEDTDDMAERIGGQECDHCLNPDPMTLNREAENLHALFQFFIGNTDFSLPMVRNLKLVSMPNGKLIPVGYDFDFSGFVNAPYALPNSDLGQSSLRDRIFLGLYTEDAIMRTHLRTFLQKKDSIISMVRDFRLLNWTEREEIIAYLESFYQEVELAQLSSRNVYRSLRQSYPSAVPVGGRGEHYGVSK